MNEMCAAGSQFPGYSIVSLPQYRALNERIVKEFFRCADRPERQSHFFHGRYENLYIGVDCVPSLQELLDAAVVQAAAVLQLEPSRLKYGYWFNLMHPGHVTSLHSHDEDDELLSCVYYLDVPRGSGDLVLHLAEERLAITPENGMFVFFPPQLEHEVRENTSASPRLSLAINFGPADE